MLQAGLKVIGLRYLLRPEHHIVVLVIIQYGHLVSHALPLHIWHRLLYVINHLVGELKVLLVILLFGGYKMVTLLDRSLPDRLISWILRSILA